MSKLPNGIRLRGKGKLIEVNFYFKGKRYYESLGLKSTKQNIKRAETLRESVVNAIKLDKLNGTDNFKFIDYFPNSINAVKTAENGNLINKDMTFKDFAVLYKKRIEDRIESRELKHSSLKSYRGGLKKLKSSSFYNMKLRKIKKSHIQGYITQLLKTLSEKSVNNMLTPLRQIFEKAFEDEIIDTNPASRVKNPKFNKPDIHPFTQSDVERILSHYDKNYPEHAAYIAFIFFTGCRIGESLAAKWENLNSTGEDWEYHIKENRVEGRITTPKTKEGDRIVPIMDSLKNYLKKQKLISFNESDFIFINPKTKKPYHKNTHIIQGSWTPTLKKLNIEYKDMRELRHTHAILSLSAGDNIHDVAKRLGHTDTSITIRTYAKFLKKYIEPSKLNNLFSNSKTKNS